MRPQTALQLMGPQNIALPVHHLVECEGAREPLNRWSGWLLWVSELWGVSEAVGQDDRKGKCVKEVVVQCMNMPGI